MTILEYFDCNNTEHLKQYRILGKTGKWNETFFNKHLKNIEFPMCWQILIANKMANCYIDRMLS